MPDQNSPSEMPVDETSESTEDQIMAEKLVEIQANIKEETDELIENGNDIDDLTKPLV